jgi:hypothetical protein
MPTENEKYLQQYKKWTEKFPLTDDVMWYVGSKTSKEIWSKIK